MYIYIYLYIYIYIYIYIYVYIHIYICCLAPLSSASWQCLGDSISLTNPILITAFLFNSFFDTNVTSNLVARLRKPKQEPMGFDLE